MEPIFSGKIRQLYDSGDDTYIFLTTDKISAFDVVLSSIVPNKGVILNKISEFWFNVTRHITPNHMISTNISEYPAEFKDNSEFKDRSMLVKKLDIIPFQFIVRGYISGGAWAEYKKTGSMWGHKVSAGLQQSQKFAEPLFTPSTKDREGYNTYLSIIQLRNAIGAELTQKIEEICMDVYNYCSKYALNCGIIIADTKFEFGFDKDENLLLADEILTPDCSRFWDVEKYQVGVKQDSYDKQFVRDWLKSIGAENTQSTPLTPSEVMMDTMQKYVHAYELLVPEDQRIKIF